MDRDTLTLIALVIAVVMLVTNLAQLWWVARNLTPDHGPRDRTRWDRATVADVTPGDVILSSAISSRPETVIATSAEGDDRIRLSFRSGRARTVRSDTSVRRHRHPAPGT